MKYVQLNVEQAAVATAKAELLVKLQPSIQQNCNKLTPAVSYKKKYRQMHQEVTVAVVSFFVYMCSVSGLVLSVIKIHLLVLLYLYQALSAVVALFSNVKTRDVELTKHLIKAVMHCNDQYLLRYTEFKFHRRQRRVV